MLPSSEQKVMIYHLFFLNQTQNAMVKMQTQNCMVKGEINQSGRGCSTDSLTFRQGRQNPLISPPCLGRGPSSGPSSPPQASHPLNKKSS